MCSSHVLSFAETFPNLLLLYVKYEVSNVVDLFYSIQPLHAVLDFCTHQQYYDLAADVLAENTHLTYKCLSPYLCDFIDAKITQQTSPEEVSWGEGGGGAG